MDKKDVAVCLGMVKEIYGRQVNTDNPEVVIKLWHRYLCDEPADLVQAAFDDWITKEKFVPRPSDILALVKTAKWAIYESACCVDLFDGESTETRLARIPRNYLPRDVMHTTSKQYQIRNRERTMESMAAVLESADLKKLGVGQRMISGQGKKGEVKEE